MRGKGSGKKLLDIRCLTTGYRGKPIIECLSLSVAKSERVVIMGPSGSGKTTLLKTIPLLVKPLSGEIWFDGVEMTGLSDDKLREKRAMIGYLPQHYVLFPHLTVIQNIILPLRVVKHMGEEEALRVAEKQMRILGIEDLAEKYPAQLSGGQRQRAAFARALSMNPKLLLLDEPTSALDPESRIDVLESLYKVSMTGIAMVIVTHEVDFALDIADRIVFMENGSIIASGDPSDLIKNNSRIGRFVRKLLMSYGGGGACLPVE